MPTVIPASQKRFFYLLSANWPARAHRWPWGLVGAFLIWFGLAYFQMLFGSDRGAWGDDFAVTHISWDDQEPQSLGYSHTFAPLPTAVPIVRKSALELVAKDLGVARASIERTVAEQSGEIVDLSTSSEENSWRKLNATIRVPVDNFDVAFARIKLLGWARHEAHDTRDVRPLLEAAERRLAEVRIEENRLLETLRNHTGKLPEIVDVEQKLSELRNEIRSLEAQQKRYLSDVRLAELKLELEEEYREPVESPPPSTTTRLRNASVLGYGGLTESALGLAGFLLGAGPALLFWVALFFFPARWAWRKWKRHSTTDL